MLGLKKDVFSILYQNFANYPNSIKKKSNLLLKKILNLFKINIKKYFIFILLKRNFQFLKMTLQLLLPMLLQRIILVQFLSKRNFVKKVTFFIFT